VNVVTGRGTPWTDELFFVDAAKRLTEIQVDALTKIYRFCSDGSFEIDWGRGKAVGMFLIKRQSICPRSLVTFNSEGVMSLNFGWIHGSERADRIRDLIKDHAVTRLSLDVPDDIGTKNPTYPIELWGNQVTELIEMLQQVKDLSNAAEEPVLSGVDQ